MADAVGDFLAQRLVVFDGRDNFSHRGDCTRRLAGDHYLRFKILVVNTPFIAVSPAVTSMSPETESAETESTFTCPLSVLRSSHVLLSLPPLRLTIPTDSTFMYLSALAEYVPVLSGASPFPSSATRLS